MHLSARRPEGKQARACTPEAHEAISASGNLFRSLAIPAGYRDERAEGGKLYELGICRNCGGGLRHDASSTVEALFDLATGRAL